MIQLIPLALASSLWPALLAVVVVCLRAAHPGRLMLSFLAAGLLTTVSVGYWVVSALKGSSLSSGSQHWFGPGLQITIGCLALLAAYVLRARARRRPAEPAPEVQSDPSRIERMLDRGVPLAFVAGILLNIVPGVVPFVALDKIADLDKGTAETLGLLLGFYVIMFWLIEVPLVGYVVAPEATGVWTRRFNAWLDRNGSLLGQAALVVIGVYLIVEGVVTSVT